MELLPEDRERLIRYVDFMFASSHPFLNPFFEENVVEPNLFRINI